MITSACSESFNSSGFNPILQKFYEMIGEIIVSKLVCGIFFFFFFFFQSSFINNFLEKNNFSEPQNHQKLNISRIIYFKKLSAHYFEDPICRYKLDGLFFRKTIFSRTWSFFHDRKTFILGVIFFHKKLILYFFSKVIIYF